jgi:hypothetical protein
MNDVDLPVEFGREEFSDELFIIGFELRGVAGVVALAVQVVRVESANRFEGFEVLLVREVGIGTLAVPAVYRANGQRGRAGKRKRKGTYG